MLSISNGGAILPRADGCSAYGSLFPAMIFVRLNISTGDRLARRVIVACDIEF